MRTPNRYGGGRYGGGREMTLSFPPFTPAVKWLIIANTAIFVLLLLLRSAAPEAYAALLGLFGLVPGAVLHGFVWQLLTYGFVHVGLGHVFFNMLGLWMFGSTIEGAWGSRRFVELYTSGILGGALVAVFLSYSPIFGGLNTLTIGASGGVYAVLMAFGIIYAESEIMLFPFPFQIKAKYFVGILVVITAIMSIDGRDGVSHLAHLGGLFTGFLYVKGFGQRGMGLAGSEWYFGLRNRYYRWKRRRAARKFEVYMRKHDRSEYFDQYGNFRDPNAGEKKDDDRGNWVN